MVKSKSRLKRKSLTDGSSRETGLKLARSLRGQDVQETELRLIPGLDEEVSEAFQAVKTVAADARPRLVDTTMLYAPRSGGVKRYLLSKKAWLADNRPDIAHSLVVPGARHRVGNDDVMRLHAAKLPFGDGYR